MNKKIMFPSDVVGGCKTPEYRNWHALLHRCYNPKNNRYYAYGARGITVAPEWLSFKQFCQDMGSRPTPTSTIERKNNDRPYSKDNCTWLESVKQGCNKSTTKLILWRGMQMSLIEWARFLQLDYKMIHARFKLGWDIDRILSTPRLEPKPFLALRWKNHNAKV